MSETIYQTIVVAAAVLFAASVFLALYRVIRGPSILDRMIATDVILASLMCGLGGYMALTGRTDLLPVLIVLAMLGFVGSVSVSRYVSKSDSMTPGAEVGALSDFSASDWHVNRDDDAGGSGSTWPDDVARGIANVADGPVEVTVRDELIVPLAADEMGADARANSPDASGEGFGAGPDPGPEDSDDGPRTGADGSRTRGDHDGSAGDGAKGGHDGP
ncbi:hypothetical protein KACC15558_16730 [Brevibacterium ammoniilyticum]|uniref:Multisubunit Na+/H+ antiporter, MnhF subunit n=1 Tax=Brevibacterium ammoniilyticum TaxID=1046555 RepID=A0ABP9TZ68_9MICO